MFKRPSIRSVLLAGTCLSVGVTSFIYVRADEMPQDPTWLTTDSYGNYGVVDTEAMPETMGVLSCTGEVVGYVRTVDLFALPDITPEQAQAQDATDVTIAVNEYHSGTHYEYRPREDRPIGYLGNECFDEVTGGDEGP